MSRACECVCAGQAACEAGVWPAANTLDSDKWETLLCTPAAAVCLAECPHRVEEVAHACCSQSHVHLDELTGAAADEGHATLTSNSTRHQRLAIAWGMGVCVWGGCLVCQQQQQQCGSTVAGTRTQREIDNEAVGPLGFVLSLQSKLFTHRHTPGGPTSSTPLGGRAPEARNFSGLRKKSTTSISSTYTQRGGGGDAAQTNNERRVRLGEQGHLVHGHCELPDCGAG